MTTLTIDSVKSADQAAQESKATEDSKGSVGLYPSLTSAEKRDALNALASRAKFAPALLDAIAAKKVPASDVPAEIIRQLRNLGDPKLNARIVQLWGIVRDTPADRKKLIAEWRDVAIPSTPAPDLSQGRAVFAKWVDTASVFQGLWVALAEKAYAQMNESGWLNRSQDSQFVPGRPLSRRVLARMGFSSIQIKQSMLYFDSSQLACDCAVYLDVLNVEGAYESQLSEYRRVLDMVSAGAL